MAAQTGTARRAAGTKAAASRKRTAAKQSGSRTKASAKQTATSARSTAGSARTTARQASRTAERRADAAATRFEALVRQAERALLIPVGAALEARDSAASTVRTYADRTAAKREFDRFERRGETALRLNTRRVQRQVRDARRDAEKRTSDLRSALR